MTDAERDIVVGIDLGTTNSLVAVVGDDGPRTIEDADGRALLPSVVRFEPDGSVVVGQDAADRSVEFPETTVSSVKRLMGRSMADAAEDLPFLSYTVVEGEHNTARVSIPVAPASSRWEAEDEPHRREAGATVVSPQEVSALILRELASRASQALGTRVQKAVVTVPAYFDDAQRQATRDAGRLAGLEVVRIVNEPTAAALAYGLGVGAQTKPMTVVVFDLGGGTFDVSILRITPNPAGAGEPAFYQVLATAGDTRLGGDDVDHALVRTLAERMRTELNVGAADGDPLSGLDAATRRALKQFSQAVKHKLSDEREARVRLDVQGAGVFDTVVTRDDLERLMGPWVDRAIRCCENAIRDAGEPDVDAVIMVGGSTRIPLVRRRVREVFGVEPYTALDPDRVVALGAAVQASIMSGASRNALLLDVIPLSLGLETAGGAVAKLVLRNSTVPARATEMFTTSVDGQTSIKIHVLQGEREMVEDCRSLGVFDLSGLPPMPAGVPQLEVEFLVDAGGVLSVTAAERRTGKRARLQVVPNHGLTREEVDRIEAESFEHARDDMQRHRVADLVVNARLDLKWIGEQLDRHGPALEAAYREELEAKRSAVAALIERAEFDWRTAPADELHAAKEDLDRSSVRLQEVAIAASLRDSDE